MEMPVFRVWHRIKDAFDPKSKEWSYIWRMSAVQILHLTAREVTIESKYGYANRLYRIGEDCILMQAVGVRDMHQTPVFTGDRVRITDEAGTEYQGVVEERGPLRVIRTGDTILTDWAHYQLEVLGNIYEQQEGK
jgi:hypothetical protein